MLRDVVGYSAEQECAGADTVAAGNLRRSGKYSNVTPTPFATVEDEKDGLVSRGMY